MGWNSSRFHSGTAIGVGSASNEITLNFSAIAGSHAGAWESE